jgi:hypothetical protein
VVIFQVSGTISLNSAIYIKNPYLTVAGQTAPSPGITVRNYGISVDTHDVLLQHFRIRPGGDTCNSALEAWGPAPYNIVFDHMSVSWGQDENIVLYNPARAIDVTIWRSIISEGLQSTPGTEGCGGGGLSPSHGLLIYAGTKEVLVGQTLFANNSQRNPNMQGDTSTVLVNNLIYQWHAAEGYLFVNFNAGGSAGGPWYASVVGNRFIPGPYTTDGSNPLGYMFWYSPNGGANPGNRIYRADNTATDSNRVVEQYNGLGYEPRVGSPPAQAPMPSGLTPLPSNQVEDFVLSSAGARPADRDPVDARIVQEVRGRSGRFIRSQNDVGGWPTLAANTRELNVPGNPHAVSPSGYTLLEEWLHGYAAAVENESAEPQPVLAPPTGVRILP